MLFHDGGRATAAAIATAATAIAATVATAMATAVATAVAAAVAATVAACVAAIAATTTMTEGHRFVVSAQQGDSDDREENRETEHNDTIHSQILQKYLRYR